MKFRAKKCDAPAEVLKDGTVCAKIDNKEGKYSFDVSVTALKCPKDSNTPRTYVLQFSVHIFYAMLQLCIVSSDLVSYFKIYGGWVVSSEGGEN